MSFETLTLKSVRVRARPVVLERPVVARIATLTDWPLILIDLYTEEGVIGRSYLEPYIRKSMRYLIPALHDLGEMFKGRRLAPIEFFEAARKSVAQIAASIREFGFTNPVLIDEEDGIIAGHGRVRSPIDGGAERVT